MKIVDGNIKDWTGSGEDHAELARLVTGYQRNPRCLGAVPLRRVPGDPRLDGRPERVLSFWPDDGRASFVDGAFPVSREEMPAQLAAAMLQRPAWALGSAAPLRWTLLWSQDCVTITSTSSTASGYLTKEVAWRVRGMRVRLGANHEPRHVAALEAACVKIEAVELGDSYFALGSALAREGWSPAEAR